MAALIGKIAPGYKADMAFLYLDHVNLVPLNNAVNQLVNTEDGAAVRDVMIGGRFAPRDGVLPGLDWPATVARAEAAAARLGRRTLARVRWRNGWRPWSIISASDWVAALTTCRPISRPRRRYSPTGGLVTTAIPALGSPHGRPCTVSTGIAATRRMPPNAAYL
jgi:hypothetical protein